jgi:hypothetical protein
MFQRTMRCKFHAQSVFRESRCFQNHQICSSVSRTTGLSLTEGPCSSAPSALLCSWNVIKSCNLRIEILEAAIVLELLTLYAGPHFLNLFRIYTSFPIFFFFLFLLFHLVFSLPFLIRFLSSFFVRPSFQISLFLELFFSSFLFYHLTHCVSFYFVFIYFFLLSLSLHLFLSSFVPIFCKTLQILQVFV